MPMTTRFRIGLLALIVTTIAMVGATFRAHAQPAPPAKDDAASDVRKLQEDRIVTLREAVELSTASYTKGLIPFIEVDRCNAMLIEAELDAAGSQKERTAVLEKALRSARASEDAANQRVTNGVSPRLDLLQATAYRLQIEIQLAKLSASKG